MDYSVVIGALPFVSYWHVSMITGSLAVYVSRDDGKKKIHPRTIATLKYVFLEIVFFMLHESVPSGPFSYPGTHNRLRNFSERRRTHVDVRVGIVDLMYDSQKRHYFVLSSTSTFCDYPLNRLGIDVSV